MKKMTAFLTIALLVSIAIFVAYASNQNRDTSYSVLVREEPDDNFPGQYSSEQNSGVDSEGPLYSVGYSSFSYFRNDEGKLRASAGACAYVSCSLAYADYKTTYSLYAKVPPDLADVHERNPQTLPRFGLFSDSVYRIGNGNGNVHRGGASGSASARGTNPSNGDQHNTSAASPTPATARDLETIGD